MLAALGADDVPVRFVGGCVRDGLLDPARDVDDLDLATPLPPEEAMRRLRAAGIRALPTGVAHGTVTALVGARRFEITSLRRDVSTDGRRATVAFTDDFDEDAARRDFTVNAMRCDADGRVDDPFRGWDDLARGRIRFVGDPMLRITEDHLRILRFFRFYARFGRPPADAAAMAACTALRAGIDQLSGERLRQELSRLLIAPRAAEALALMNAAEITPLVLSGPVDPEALEALVRVAPEADWLLRLAALLGRGSADSDAVRATAHRLRLSTAEAMRLERLTLSPLPDPPLPDAAHRAAAWRAGPPTYDALLILAQAAGQGDARRARAMLAAWEPPACPVGGDDLLAQGVPPGPDLGRRLRALRDAWIDSDFTLDRDALLARPDP